MKGKHNGRPIVGFRVILVFDWKHWIVNWGSVHYTTCWALGPVRVWLSAEYDRTIR